MEIIRKKTASWLLSWWLCILDVPRCWKMDVVKFLPPPKSMSSPPSVLWEQFDGGPNPNKRMHRTYSNLVNNGINLDKLIEYLSFSVVFCGISASSIYQVVSLNVSFRIYVAMDSEVESSWILTPHTSVVLETRIQVLAMHVRSASWPIEHCSR